MATTSGELASQALDAMASQGMPFAFLHREAQAARGDIGSDVDLVVDRPAASIASAVTWPGLRPVMIWPYDEGAASIFLVTGTATDGVQLDVTWDASGRNKYQLRARQLLDGSGPGVRWPTITQSESDAYVERKRAWKAKGTRNRPSPRRLLGRVARPVGFWAHLGNPELALPIASRFSRVLPRVERPTFLGHGVLSKVVLRRLPCLALTHGSRWSPLKPDACLDAVSIDDACDQLTARMRIRLESGSLRHA